MRRSNAGDRVLVLVNHEPTLDPRVHYTAQSLAKKYVVTVLALAQESEARPAANEPGDAKYRTIRLPFEGRRWMGVPRAFVEIWLRTRLGDTRLTALVVPPLAVLITVAVTTAAIVFGVVVDLVALPFLLPFILVNESRLRVVPFGLKMVRRLVRAVWPGGLPHWRPLAPLRVTSSVLIFICRVNAQLWRYAIDNDLKADVVYCHDLWTLQAGVMLKWRWGAKLIYDSHEYYPYQYPFWCFSTAIRRYEATLTRAVDAYITVSPQLAEELARVYRVGRVHVIPNVEPCPPSRAWKGESPMSGLARERVKILYQGTFAEGRGLEEVISEWCRVDGTRAALFLRGPKNPVRDGVEELAAAVGVLGESVYVLPPVLEKDLIGAAQDADVGLIPYKTDWLSYRFACPNKLSQYLHAGLAILSNRLPYVEQVVREGGLGLCYDLRAPGSLARAVHALTEDREAIDVFKKNARSYAEQHFNWERFEGALLRLVAEA